MKTLRSRVYELERDVKYLEHDRDIYRDSLRDLRHKFSALCRHLNVEVAKMPEHMTVIDMGPK